MFLKSSFWILASIMVFDLGLVSATGKAQTPQVQRQLPLQFP